MSKGEERILVLRQMYVDDFIHIVVSHISAYKFYTICGTPVTKIYLDSGARIEVEMSMEEFLNLLNGDKDGIQR